MRFPRLLSTWVKMPTLRGKSIAVVSACLEQTCPEILEELARDHVVLVACPEQEGGIHYAKLATILRTSGTKRLTIVTVDGSPHCFTLQASANLAIYVTDLDIERKHYVVLQGCRLVEISPDSIRIARYLHLVDKLVKSHKDVLKELEKHSLEYQASLRQGAGLRRE